MRGARESLTEPMRPGGPARVITETCRCGGCPGGTARAAAGSVFGRARRAEADAHLVGAGEQVGGVGVDPVGTGPLKLLPAVAAGQHADPDGPGAARGEQVPDAVPDDERGLGLDA